MLTHTTSSSRKEFWGISHFPASPTGISNMSLLDHNSTCFPMTPWNATGKLLIGNLIGQDNYFVLWTNCHQYLLNCYQHCKWNIQTLRTYKFPAKQPQYLQSKYYKLTPLFDGQPKVTYLP